jgi:hypothetical protein
MGQHRLTGVDGTAREAKPEKEILQQAIQCFSEESLGDGGPGSLGISRAKAILALSRWDRLSHPKATDLPSSFGLIEERMDCSVVLGSKDNIRTATSSWLESEAEGLRLIESFIFCIGMEAAVTLALCCVWGLWHFFR